MEDSPSGQAWFRALVEEASEIVVVLDNAGRMRFANPALERLLGRTLDAFTTGLRLDLVHVDDVAGLVRAWKATVATPRAQGRLTCRALHANGTWTWLDGIFTNLLDDPIIGGVVFNARDVSEQKRLEDELRHHALHDPLTGLANRALLARKLEHALRPNSSDGSLVAALFLDIDFFKRVNDRFGHAAGDALLKAFTERVSAALRGHDTFARVGGDEFVVLLPGIQDERDARSVADRLQEVMEVPIRLQGHDIHVGLSIGIAFGVPGQTDADTLLRSADSALFVAKNNGRGQTVASTPRMLKSSIRRQTLELDLRHAAIRNELTLHYQPIVDLATGCIEHVEALLRWHHPRYGLVPAEELVDIAEATRHIHDLGRWVVEEACAQLRRWGTEAPGVAINASASQFRNPDMVEELECAAKKAGVDLKKFRLEITEHTIVDDVVLTAATLDRLRERGVTVAIDDFGTGYSSLRYLRELPVDTIKLDRSFVHELDRDADAQAIVAGVTSMAHAIGLTVAAEGVETEAQLRYLNDVGCDQAQGFLFAHPVPGGPHPPTVTLPSTVPAPTSELEPALVAAEALSVRSSRL